jgi:hypothetical protein
MRAILTAKTGKISSTEKEIDRTVDFIEPFLVDLCDNNGYKWTGIRCFEDGTQIIIEK